MNEEGLHAAVARIDRLARTDAGGRGLSAFAAPGDLLAAADALLAGQRVVVVTGFCVRAAMVGENDGPPGALAVAAALRALGKEVVLVSDAHSERVLDTGSRPYGVAFPTLILSLAQDEAELQMRALLASFAPTQVLAIERPGSAPDGHRYSMHGEILDDLVPATDILLAPPFTRNYATIAVGDGGNELGFGGLREALKGHVALGERIFCSTAADYVIPAGVSNWGAYALAATLSLLAGRLLIRPSDEERAVLEAMLAAGAVDGCTRRAELTVDGLSWDVYSGVIDAIYQTASAALETHAGEASHAGAAAKTQTPA